MAWCTRLGALLVGVLVAGPCDAQPTGDAALAIDAQPSTGCVDVWTHVAARGALCDRMLRPGASRVAQQSTPRPEPPRLSRDQRAALQAIVQAIDAAGEIPAMADADWPIHLLRASDGSHYVAFTVAAPDLPKQRPIVLYVRLATRFGPETTGIVERSAVAEWLAGQTTTPPMARRGIAFGEMPVYGAGSIAARAGTTVGPQSLQLMELERERARERREAEERKRKAALEGEATDRNPRPLLPFEDFEASFVAATDDGRLARSLTTGPGDYDLIVGWADPAADNVSSSVRLLRRRLTLPPASTTELALSSVIVADDVAVRETPLMPDQQASRPYSIGTMEITPATDTRLTNDERLAFVVQVINPRGSVSGKPNVAVTFRVFRRVGEEEVVVGSLAPQVYDESTLPPDFDVAKRHPIFAAVGVPLGAFKRGDYRLEISAHDRIAGAGTTADARFTVVATPAALLRDAPPIVPAYRREELLEGRIIDELIARVSPPEPSQAFIQAVAAARDARYVELLREDAVTEAEASARSVLRTLARYAFGDSSTSLAAPLRQARQQSVSPAAVELIEGALHALQGRDRESVAAWEAAISAGADAEVMSPLLAGALLRQGDAARAIDLLERGVQREPDSSPRLAVAYLLANRPADALRLLDAQLTRQPDDLQAQWLALQALFSGFVAGTGPGADAAGRARIVTLGERYIAANGPHAALAREWVAAVQ